MAGTDLIGYVRNAIASGFDKHTTAKALLEAWLREHPNKDFLVTEEIRKPEVGEVFLCGICNEVEVCVYPSICAPSRIYAVVDRDVDVAKEKAKIRAKVAELAQVVLLSQSLDYGQTGAVGTRVLARKSNPEVSVVEELVEVMCRNCGEVTEVTLEELASRDADIEKAMHEFECCPSGSFRTPDPSV